MTLSNMRIDRPQDLQRVAIHASQVPAQKSSIDGPAPMLQWGIHGKASPNSFVGVRPDQLIISTIKA
jgi:hypothetical protein